MDNGPKEDRIESAIQIADLVKIPMSDDVGILLEVIDIFAKVYWQNMGKARTELYRDLEKIN